MNMTAVSTDINGPYRMRLGRRPHRRHIVQEFNTNYVLRYQRHCAVDGSFSEDHIAQMEQFREEFTALLRDIELWATGISGYLRSMDATNNVNVSGIAPIAYFVRAKSFRQAAPARV